MLNEMSVKNIAQIHSFTGVEDNGKLIALIANCELNLGDRGVMDSVNVMGLMGENDCKMLLAIYDSVKSVLNKYYNISTVPEV